MPSSVPCRLGAALLVMLMTSGCTSMVVPYLDPKPLNDAATCSKEDGTGQVCGVVARFIQTRDAVKTVQTEAHNSYVDRARINSISSALAFPLAGWALYRGVNPNGDSAQNQLLRWGLVVGAGYEVRNTLMANSPEAIYMLSEARLSCVLDEASRYRLDLPNASANCTTAASAVEDRAYNLDASLPTLTDAKDAGLKNQGQALAVKAHAAVSQFNSTEATLQMAADQMQSAARRILVDTNGALKSPSISFNQATTLMTSEVAAFKPSTSVNTDGAKSNSGPAGKVANDINALVDKLNAFGQVCLRPQPATPAFANCTTYSPAAPPASTIVASLAGDSVSMQVGSKLTFVATSSPSGTPWATFAGDDQTAVAALGTPQLVTLSPNQTQVTLNYANAVKTETKVTLNLTTLGVTSVPKSIEITLKTAAAPIDTGTDTGPAPTPNSSMGNAAPKVLGAAWTEAITKHPDLLKKLNLNNPKPEELKEQLNIQWRTLCNVNQDAKDDNLLLREAFIADVTAGKSASNPVPPYCSN